VGDLRGTLLDVPCLVGCLALFMPRIAIVLVVIFSDYIGRAYATVIWPLLGFFFLPLTTLAYAWAMNENGSVSGLYLVVLILAVLIDLGLLGSSASSPDVRSRIARRKWR
jgi:hypothetical protein